MEEKAKTKEFSFKHIPAERFKEQFSLRHVIDNRKRTTLIMNYIHQTEETGKQSEEEVFVDSSVLNSIMNDVEGVTPIFLVERGTTLETATLWLEIPSIFK